MGDSSVMPTASTVRSAALQVGRAPAVYAAAVLSTGATYTSCRLLAQLVGPRMPRSLPAPAWKSKRRAVPNNNPPRIITEDTRANVWRCRAGCSYTEVRSSGALNRSGSVQGVERPCG